MRESSKTERMHLGDIYEEWLKRQSPHQKSAKHQKHPGDAYEAWVQKRVEKRLGALGRAKPAAS